MLRMLQIVETAQPLNLGNLTGKTEKKNGYGTMKSNYTRNRDVSVMCGIDVVSFPSMICTKDPGSLVRVFPSFCRRIAQIGLRVSSFAGMVRQMEYCNENCFPGCVSNFPYSLQASEGPSVKTP